MLSGQFKLSISTLPLGHVHGMGQPSVGLSVTLDVPSHFSMEAAKTALSEVFLLTEEEMTPLRVFKKQTLAPALDDYLRCAFALARSLLQEGGLPVFAPEVIHHVEPEKGPHPKYMLQLKAPAMENFDRTQIAAAYVHGLNAMWLYATPTPDRAAFKLAADALFESFIGPLRRTLNRGLSTTPLLKEAFNRGIPTTHLGAGVFQFGTGSHARLIRKSATDNDSAIGANVAKQKDFAELWFKSVGAPVATSLSVQDKESAVAAAHRIGFPVVVKPSNLDRSEGVFLDLATDEAVRDAYDRARKLSPRILVQSRIPGHCHRLVTFKGRFVFAYTRYPAAVKGNGETSVRDLVQRFNDAHYRKARHLQTKPLPFDDEALECLTSQGLSPDDIPETDRLAFLRKNNVVEYAGHNEIVTDKVHPENIAVVERLSKLFRLESVGADLISTDPTRPWYETGGAITEINFEPQVGENTARSNIAAMFPQDSTGTIPIECFVGGQGAMRAARRRLGGLAANQVRAALTSHDISLDHRGRAYRFAGMNSLRDRCIALLSDTEIETLVVVVQTDEFVVTGPPFKGNVQVTRIDSGLRRAADPRQPVSPAVLHRLVRALTGG